MGSKFERLLEPIKTAEVEIKNRIAMAPEPRHSGYCLVKAL